MQYNIFHKLTESALCVFRQYTDLMSEVFRWWDKWRKTFPSLTQGHSLKQLIHLLRSMYATNSKHDSKNFVKMKCGPVLLPHNAESLTLILLLFFEKCPSRICAARELGLHKTSPVSLLILTVMWSVSRHPLAWVLYHQIWTLSHY